MLTAGDVMAAGMSPRLLSAREDWRNDDSNMPGESDLICNMDYFVRAAQEA